MKLHLHCELWVSVWELNWYDVTNRQEMNLGWVLFVMKFLFEKRILPKFGSIWTCLQVLGAFGLIGAPILNCLCKSLNILKISKYLKDLEDFLTVLKIFNENKDYFEKRNPFESRILCILFASFLAHFWSFSFSY